MGNDDDAQAVMNRLSANDWKNIRLWSGDAVTRIYVTSRSGFDCGYIESRFGGSWVSHLTRHEGLILSAANLAPDS